MTDGEKFWNSIYSEADAKKYIIWGAKNDEEFNARTPEESRFIIEQLNINEKDNVLEYGCGIGRLMKAIAPHCKNVVGIDVSNNMIGMSHKYLEGLMNAQTYTLETPLRPGSFDKAFSFIVMQHMDKYKVFFALKKIKQLLAPGGKGLFQFPDLLKNDRSYEFYAKDSLLPPDQCCGMNFWTQEEAAFIFELAGWRNVKIINSAELRNNSGTDFWVVAE